MEEKLLKMLHEDQVITEEQYQRVLDEHERTGHHCEAILQQFHILTEEALVEYLSQKFRMPAVPWNDYTLDPELLELVPEALAIQHTVFPFDSERSKRGGKILLAIADPSNVAAIDEIAFRTGCTVKTAIASTRAIREAIRENYGVEELETPRPGSTRIEPVAERSKRFPATEIEAFDKLLAPLFQSPDFHDEDDDLLSTLDREHPASKVLIELLELAVDRDISEIHFEPFDQEYRVRIRRRSVLRPHTTIPDHVGRGIGLRLRRLMRHAGVAGQRQDHETWSGNFQTGRIRNTSLTVVVNFYPTLYGEKILLKPSALPALPAIDHLGLADKPLKLLQRMLAKTEGIVLLLGPPDHGKTTTLYSLLSHYRQHGMHALLIESPVERVMPGMTQLSGHMPLSEPAWHTLVAYANPDVLAVSDSEDDLLLRFVFDRASATKVLASYTASHSLHGFRAFAEAMQTALNRSLPALLPVLLDLLDGIVVQRLIRTLCPHCKEVIPAAEQPTELLQPLGLDGEAVPLYRAKGCSECFDSGYQGQTGIFEVIRCDPNVSQALLQHPPISDAHWHQVLADSAVRTLRQQGAHLVQTGVSSPQEIRRALAA